MHIVIIYRLFVIGSVLSGLIYGLLSFVPEADSDLTTVLAWNGYGGALESFLYSLPNWTKPVSLVLCAIIIPPLLLCPIGMIFYWRWARWAYLIAAIVGILFLATFGLRVDRAFQTPFDALSWLFLGISICMSFLPPISLKFTSKAEQDAAANP